MRSNARARVATLAVLLACVVPTWAGLDHGGFETGDLAGWESSIPITGAIWATTESLEHFAFEGSYFALLAGAEAGSPTRLWRTLEVQAGDTLSGWAFFESGDALPWDDYGEIVLRAGSAAGAVVATLFSVSVADVGEWGSTEWTFFEHVFPSSGTYVLEARVVNDLDRFNDSYLGLDDVVLTTSDAPLEITIDVKPGSAVNPVQRRSKGRIPVAVLGSSDFQVSEVDVASLAFGPDGAGAWKGKAGIQDVNGDGIADLVVHFAVPACGFAGTDAQAVLSGQTTDGRVFEGRDRIRVK